MIAMIFEFWFDPERPELHEEYLNEAEEIRRVVASSPGVRSVERFVSVTDPHRYVAVGTFDDETAVAAWRNHPAHRRVQGLGRSRLFAGYRLRMCEILRDYGPGERAEAPADLPRDVVLTRRSAP